MSNMCIVVLIGLPGAGKTHFYKYIVDNLHLDNTKISHISYDEQEKFVEKTEYKNFRRFVYEKVDKLLNEITETNSKDNNEVIVIDDNMFYRSMRRSFYNLAKKYGSGFCEVFIKCNTDLAIERNNKRKADSVPTTTITRMSEKLEPPSKDNSWEKFSCEISSETEYNEEDLKIFINLFQDALKDPVVPDEVSGDVPEQRQSYTHQVDLMLRKLVSRNIKEAIVANKPQIIIKMLSDELLLRKKALLDNLKNKELFLPEFDDDDELEKILSEFLETEEVEIDGISSKKTKYTYTNGNSSTNGSHDTY